jgi:hypothetical protein
LDGKQAELDKEKNFEILYNFYLSINMLDNKIDKLDGIINDKIVEITRAYFHYAKIAFHKELIIHFRNIWYNSVVNIDDNTEEQIFMFNILSSLTPDKIKILKLAYNSYKSDIRDSVHVGMKGVLGIPNISSDLGFSDSYSRVLCLALVGNGLLIDANVNPHGDRAYFFSINIFFEKFLQYVFDYDGHGAST